MKIIKTVRSGGKQVRVELENHTTCKFSSTYSYSIGDDIEAVVPPEELVNCFLYESLEVPVARLRNSEDVLDTRVVDSALLF